MAPKLDAWQGLVDSDPAAASRLLRQMRGKLWVPHSGGQRDVLASQARFRILRAGRRWGKTELAAHEVIMAALKKEGQMVWWVANSDKNVRRGYRKVLSQLPRELLAKRPPSEHSNDRVLHFLNGSTIEFYTAGTPDSLAGEGVDFLVVDEAALILENVWYQLLRPTLSDKGGRALIISTPRGRNWFWKIWMRGERGGDYAAWHFTSFDNPYVPDEEIEDVRATLPSLTFKGEYLAEFLDDAAAWFDVRNAVTSMHEPDRWVMLGVDLGKHDDFTVLSGCNAETRLPVYFDRFNKIKWTEQLPLIVQAVRELEGHPNVEGVTVGVDSTGLGDVIYDQLDDLGLDVVPISFGSGKDNKQKELMAKLLAADIEQGRAFILPEMEDEFQNYEYEMLPSGRMRFEAATGHDDKVSAKMIENWICEHEAPPGVQTLEVEKAPDVAPPLSDKRYRSVVTPDSPEDIMSRPDAWNN